MAVGFPHTHSAFREGARDGDQKRPFRRSKVLRRASLKANPKTPKANKASVQHTQRKWRVPPNIQDYATSFCIDSEVRKAKLQSRVQPPVAVAIGRRTLEVAIQDASTFQTRLAAEELAYWTRIANAAAKTELHLKSLLKQIKEDRLHLGRVIARAVRVPASWTSSGKITVRLSSPERKTLHVEALRTAYESIADFANKSKHQRKTLSKFRKNEGDPGKRAFVYRLAEGWIYLTGKRPGKSYNPRGNPFLRFVLSAWQDAGLDPDGEDFSRALDSTLIRLERYEGWSWSPQSRETISGLIEDGPEWLR